MQICIDNVFWRFEVFRVLICLFSYYVKVRSLWKKRRQEIPCGEIKTNQSSELNCTQKMLIHRITQQLSMEGMPILLLSPKHLLKTRSARAGWSEPYLIWYWITLRMEIIQAPWKIYSSLRPHSQLRRWVLCLNRISSASTPFVLHWDEVGSIFFAYTCVVFGVIDKIPLRHFFSQGQTVPTLSASPCKKDAAFKALW